MSSENYFGNDPEEVNDDLDDFWGDAGEQFWKWDHVGKEFVGVVNKRTTKTFAATSQNPKPVTHPALKVKHDDGQQYTMTVSQKYLRGLMKSARITEGVRFRAQYVRDERTPNGVAKIFELEILSRPAQAA